MKTNENKLIMQLKANFFDILHTESNEIEYEVLLRKMLLSIKGMLSAQEITLYSYNEWKQSLYIQFSTDESLINTEIPNYLCQQIEEMAKTQPDDFRQMPEVHKKRYDFFIPLTKNEESIGFLFIKEGPVSPLGEVTQETLRRLSVESATFVQKAYAVAKIIHEERRYRQLYRVTSKFHSTMDMDEVLGEIIETLQEVYPTFNYYLLLSQDTTCRCDLPVRDLQYDSENVTAMQAYLTGEIRIESRGEENISVLYAPLKGKQGVYGILQINAPNTRVFPENEVNFIELLANTGGAALENAKLYQQSKRLISDLQLINETSHHLNENLRLNDSIEYISNQIVESFAAEEVGFILFAESKNGELHVLPGSTPYFLEEDSMLYVNYLDEKIKKEKDSFFIGDLSLQSEQLKDVKYRSIIGIPMIEGNNLKGFSIIMHQEPYQFTFDSFKLLQSLIHHSTLAITNSMLHEELEKMVITDHLTKLHSRNYLDDTLQKSMKNDGYGTFILIDLDDFKKVNDTYGHQVGDEVLVQVANIIKNNIRDSDVGARWGGEELAIYLPRIEVSTGEAIAERFLTKVSEGTNPRVTISIGVSSWKKEEDDSVKELFQRADQALYEAKAAGKNRMIVKERQDYPVSKMPDYFC